MLQPSVVIHPEMGGWPRFLFGKTREAQRFLYNLSPRGTGDKGKEDRNGTYTKNVESYGYRG